MRLRSQPGAIQSTPRQQQSPIVWKAMHRMARVLDIVRLSRGRVDAVTDMEMASARAALLEFDGLDAEFSSCAGVALLMRDTEMASEGTVCIITASGHKHTFAGDVPTPKSEHEAVDRLRDFFADDNGVEILG